jgi:hypothetical protein
VSGGNTHPASGGADVNAPTGTDRDDLPERIATDDEVAQLFTLEATHAAGHARCGRDAKCRRDALTLVDSILDTWLTRHPSQPHDHLTTA